MPRPGAQKAETDSFYCGYTLATGENAHFGSPLRVHQGDPLPPTQPGTGLREVPGTYVCPGEQCQGPLAPLFKKLVAALGWPAPAPMAPFALRRLNDRYAKLKARRLWPRQAPPRTPSSGPPLGGAPSTYCCICGETGLCWIQGVDCRFLPVLQRRLGQC